MSAVSIGLARQPMAKACSRMSSASSRKMSACPEFRLCSAALPMVSPTWPAKTRRSSRERNWLDIESSGRPYLTSKAWMPSCRKRQRRLSTLATSLLPGSRNTKRISFCRRSSDSASLSDRSSMPSSVEKQGGKSSGPPTGL